MLAYAYVYKPLYWLNHKKNGDTELIYAITMGERDICKMLIDSGADVNMANNVSNIIHRV